MLSKKVMRRLALIVVLASATSGCFLQTLSGATFQTGNNLITTVRTDSILATCVQGGATSANVECTYFFFDENGVPVSVTSSAQLISEFGILGVVIDPLIYQIPGNATNIVGTYTDANAGSGDLVILSGFKSIPLDVSRTLVAELGQQFVIAELPGGVPFEGQQFEFSLSFEQPAASPTPVSVKPMLAMKYEAGGQVFYPPFLPCVHDVADIPAVTIPVAATPQPIALTQTPTVCNGEFYPLIGFGVFACDFDGDDDVDSDDLALQSRARNAPALPGDRMDADSDGRIDLNDVRVCANQCLQPRCAVMNGPPAIIQLPKLGSKR